MIISLSDKEVNCIDKYLKPTDIMLEWGSGGSTPYFGNQVEEYYSIEHSQKWFDITSEGLKEYKLIKKIGVFFIPSNKPRTRPTKREEFEDYVNVVNQLKHKYDKVLIDGRARLYCGIEVLPWLKEDAIVFLHDCSRSEYKEIYEYYDLIKIVDRLAVLKKK